MADGDFKLAGAYVELNLKDNTPADEAKTRGRIESGPAVEMPVDLGNPDVAKTRKKTQTELDADPAKIPTTITPPSKEDTERSRRPVEDQPPAKIPTELGDPVLTAWRAKLDAQIRSIATDSLKIPTTPDAELFRSRLSDQLAEIRANVHGDIPMQPADLADFHQKIDAAVKAATEGVEARIPVKVDTKGAQAEGERAGGLLLAGMVAAAPIAGAALAAGIGVGLAGGAALIQRNNTQVKDSVRTLGTDVGFEMRSITDQTVTYISSASDLLDHTLADLGPQLKKDFSYAGPDLMILTSGVDNLARNAMPGLDAAAENSEGPLRGVATLMGGIGTSFSSLVQGFTSRSAVLEHGLDETSTLLTSVTGAVGTLTSSALPGLDKGFTSTVTVVTGVLSALKPVTPLLGAIAGNVLPVVGSFKLFGTLSAPITAAGTKLGSFADKMGAAGTISASTAKRLNDTGGAVSKLGGAVPIVGAAFTAADMILQAFGSTSDQMAQSLLAGGSAAQTAAGKIAGMNPLLASSVSGLSDVQKAQALYNYAVAQQGPNSDAAAAALHLYDLASSHAATTQQTLSDSVGKTGEAAVAVAPEIGTLSGDTAILANKSTDASTQLQALLDKMHLIAEGGAQSANDAIEASWKAVDQLKTSLAGAKGPLLDANGSLNLTSTRGQAARDAIKSIADQLGTYAKSLNDQHVPAQQMFQDLQRQEDQLAGKLGPALHLSTQQVEALFAREGLIPANIATQFKTPGLAQAIADNSTLFTKVAELPAGKSITVTAPTSSALSALQDLGYKIVHLPDGKITISARDNATNTVNQIVRSINGKVAYIDVQANYQLKGAARMSALGNLFQPNASGNLDDVTRMPSNVATMVPPDTLRVVGDNMAVPELYAPLNGSTRTKQLITAAAAHEHVQTGGGNTTEINNYITQQPMEDGVVLAGRVSAETAWALQTQVGG